MTNTEFESENEYLRERNKELSETITELKSEILSLRSETEADLEPRFYFNRIVDDYAGLDEEDVVDKLKEIRDYLNAFIGNHTIGDKDGNASENLFDF